MRNSSCISVRMDNTIPVIIGPMNIARKELGSTTSTKLLLLVEGIVQTPDVIRSYKRRGQYQIGA